MQDSPWWPALVATIERGLQRGWNLPQLIDEGDRADLAGHTDPCQGWVWRLSLLTDRSEPGEDEPIHPDQQPPDDLPTDLFPDRDHTPVADPESVWLPDVADLVEPDPDPWTDGPAGTGEMGEMDLDDALSSRDQIKARLKEAISDDIADWGITLKTVEIQDINPSQRMQTAMEEQAAAERQRRATVSRAEGSKTAAILEAEGRLEASRRDADAQVLLAQASQRAIELVTEAVKDNELPAMFLLGERYINSIREMAGSQNGKLVLLPADLPAAIRGMLGK